MEYTKNTDLRKLRKERVVYVCDERAMNKRAFHYDKVIETSSEQRIQFNSIRLINSELIQVLYSEMNCINAEEGEWTGMGWQTIVLCIQLVFLKTF